MSDMVPRVFVDVSARKHSITKRTLLRPIGTSRTYQFVEEDIVKRVPESLASEIRLLSKVADLARSGSIRLLRSSEDTHELLGILMIPATGESVFLGVEYEFVPPPVDCSRILLPRRRAPNGKIVNDQAAFLETIKDKRFLEIQKACGAFQGANRPPQSNQLVDAFHVWCAEAAGASHFLTTDLKLTQVVPRYNKAPVRVKVVSPSQLLADLMRDR